MDQSHMDQKYFIDRDVYNCPFCNRRNVCYSVSDTFSFDWSAGKKCYGFLATCDFCQKASMHLSYSQLDQGWSGSAYSLKEGLKDIDSEIFYSVPTSFFTIDARVPGIVRELITEAEGSLKMNYLTGASACMRKAVYELLLHEGLDCGHYGDRIKSLKKKHPSIHPDLFDILGGIQEMTSDKIHEQSWDKWDSHNIRMIIETLKAILHEIFVRPDERTQQILRIRQLRERALPNRQVEAQDEDKSDA